MFMLMLLSKNLKKSILLSSYEPEKNDEAEKKIIILESHFNKKEYINEKSCDEIKKCKSSKEKEKRVITKTTKWNKDYIEFEKHYNILLFLANSYNLDFLLKESFSLSLNELESTSKNESVLLENQLSIKINGYKSQDLKKNKFNLDNFVDIKYVIEKLVECKLECCYCKQKCLLLYENVRDPKQWSLERIDNSIGHDKNNVEIACLSCNIKRKIMNCEKFIFSNQCKNITKIS